MKKRNSKSIFKKISFKNFVNIYSGCQMCTGANIEHKLKQV